MGQERWFRGQHDGQNRPFDWLTAARQQGIPEKVARALYERALQQAHGAAPGRVQEIYLALLAEAHRDASRPSPGKVTRTMRLAAERAGRRREPHVSHLTGQPIAPGRRTLARYLEPAVHGARAHEELLQTDRSSFRAPVESEDAQAGTNQSDRAPAGPSGATRRSAWDVLVPGTVAHRRFQADLAAALGHFEELAALEADTRPEPATVIDASPMETGAEDLMYADPDGWSQSAGSQPTLDWHAREWPANAWSIRWDGGQPEFLESSPALAGRAVEEPGAFQPIQAAGLQDVDGGPVRLPDHGSGAEMPEELRDRMEAAFGVDFSRVRIHEGPHVQAIGALAYTQGTDIHFAPGQYDPTSRRGQELLAHELTHVVQQSQGRVRATMEARGVAVNADTSLEREADHMGARAARGEAESALRVVEHAPLPRPQAGAPLQRNADPGAPPVKEIVDRILQHLNGPTFWWNSTAILQEFQNRNAATVHAILDELKSRAGEHDQTPRGMIQWLLGDLAEEDRRKLETILLQSGAMAEIGPELAGEMADLLQGWTSEDNSSELLAILRQLRGGQLDQALQQLETKTDRTGEALGEWLFDDLTREDAERLRQHMFKAGGPHAIGYAVRSTARKIEALLGGYTGHADSGSILENLVNTPEAQRGAVLGALDGMTRARWQQSAEDALMEDMDQSDYEELRALPGVTLREYDHERGAAETLLSAVEWVEIVAEVIAGGAVGVVTGLISVLWDLVALVIDIAVAAYNLIMSCFYLASGGLVGSDEWLATKEFIKGLGALTEPEQILAAAWEDIKLGSATIEGPLEYGRRAEYWTRKVVNFVVNVVLIVKGLIKGGEKLGDMVRRMRLARSGEGAAAIVNRIKNLDDARALLATVPDAELLGQMLDKVQDAQLLRRLVTQAGDAEKLASVLGKLAPSEVPAVERLLQRFPDVAKLDGFLSRVPAGELLRLDAAAGAGKLGEVEAALQALSGKLDPAELGELRKHLLRQNAIAEPPSNAHNAADFVKLNQSLGIAEEAEPLIESLRATGRLPANYVTKSTAAAAGWKPGKPVGTTIPGAQIGGDIFQNTTSILPSAPGRVWYEADVGLSSAVSRSKQPGTRLLYSNDGLLYITPDHYTSVHPIGRWK